MKKAFLLKSLMLLCMLMTGMGAWAEDETITLANGAGSGDPYSITWSGTSCDITQTKGSGTAVSSSYISAPRWYQSNVVSFKAKSGYTLTGATVACTTNAYATALKNSTYSSSASASVSTSTVTITSNGDFDITMGAQSRISSITIHYSAASTPAVGLGGTSLDFGTVTQNEVVEAKTISATLSNVSSATVSLSGTGASAFSIDKTSLSANGDITITPNTANIGTYEATLSLSATGATTVSKTISMTVVEPFNGTITTMSAANDADIKFVTGSSSAANAVWANSTPLTTNNVTLSGEVTSGTNYSYYDGSVVRFYTNNNIVITPENGATITKIEIVRQTTTGSNTGTINCSGLTASKDNTTTNTNVYTGTATSAVTFTASAQARLTAIVVYTTGGKTLQSVAVSGTPTKTTYAVGDSFDPTGLTVTGYYDKGDPEVITKGITWSTPAPLVAGQTSVEITATVNDITSAAYTVTGLTVKYISSISVSGTPEEFWKGDAFNHDGMTVTATYSDDSQVDVTDDAIFSGYDMSAAGAQTVTVTYGGQTDTYEINVQTIANTQATAYTTTQAKALVDAGKDLNTEVYVTGVVSSVEKYNETYKSITYWLDDDAFEIYGGLAAVGDEFSSIDDIEEGATVVVLGKITKYNTTYEMNKDSHLVSYTAPAPVAKTIDFYAAGEDGYYTTFSNDKAVTIPEMIEVDGEYAEFTVYSVYAVGDMLELQDLTDELCDGDTWYLSENEGYLIKAEFSGDVTYTGEAAISVEYTELNYDLNSNDAENFLRPASEAKTGDNKYYMLAYSDNSCTPASIGFYWGAADGAAFESRANSAYLALSKSTQAKGFRLKGDTATGIKNVNANENTVIYNLACQRLNKMQKGINIVNGRKVLNK